jgi:hypothetical protein
MKHTRNEWLANTALLIAIVAPLTLAFVKTVEQARRAAPMDPSDGAVYAQAERAYGIYGVEWMRSEMGE